jgi:hypothetical protein
MKDPLTYERHTTISVLLHLEALTASTLQWSKTWHASATQFNQVHTSHRGGCPQVYNRVSQKWQAQTGDCTADPEKRQEAGGAAKGRGTAERY